jgi:hypothetical protein
MAAAAAIQCEHSPDGGIQWLKVKPWMYFIGRCAPQIALPHPHGHRNRCRFACIFCRFDFVVGHNHKLKTML